MKFPLIVILIFTLLSPSHFEVSGQETVQKPKTINFFLDCYHCDFTFVRQELPFVSFVRDPQLADVHVLVTDSETGSGGTKYFLNFIGLKDFKGTDFEYIVSSKQSDTEDDIRKILLKTIKIGMLQYFSKNDNLDNLKIDIEDNGNRKAGDMVIDPWNKWVFRLETEGILKKEQQQNEYSIASEASAEKITENWKTAIEGRYEINRENYYKDDSLITDKQNSKDFSAEYVKSLSDKWSAGFFGYYSSNTFLNIKHNYITYAGIEYNIFPWNECNRRILAIRYGTGISIYKYYEETIYDKMKESLWTELLSVKLKLIQQWGELSMELEGSHYFRDFSKNRLTLETDFSIRLTKNFSVFCELQSAAVHDQIYLSKGDASLEDILLKRHKLATTYELNGQIGFRFTFGSIFNNVVNERF